MRIWRTSLLLLGLLLGGELQAAGMTTHALGAERSVAYLRSADLKSILLAQRSALLSGGAFPDSGYVYGDYGEVSHWERFILAYADHLREKAAAGDCGDIRDPGSACAAMVAHLMGAAAHGLMDETWDWLFEPLVTDHGEAAAHPVPVDLISNIEYAMDMIAIVDYYRWPDVPLYQPPYDDLLAVYARIGREDVTRDDLTGGFVGVTTVLTAERAGAAADSTRIRMDLPWSSAHFYAESGGVTYSARAIAGYLEAVWSRVLSDQSSPLEVIAVHPEPNETRVTWQFADAGTSPGPATGGGEQRIIAVLSKAVSREGSPVSPVSMRLYEGDVKKKNEVSPRDGFPTHGPYNGDGTHSILFHPARDLLPCTVHTVVVTTALTSVEGDTLPADYTWRFATRAADQGDCE